MKLLSAFGLTLLVTCSAMAQSPVAGQQPPPGGQHAGDLSQPLLLVPGSVADDATPLLGPPWGPPGWPNSPPDPSPPPKKKCYKTERYCTEWLPDGHCKLWDTRKVEVPC